MIDRLIPIVGGTIIAFLIGALLFIVGSMIFWTIQDIIASGWDGP